jgi:hypothetical protein
MKMENDNRLENMAEYLRQAKQDLIDLEDAILECRLLSKDDEIISIFAAPMEEGYYELRSALDNALIRKSCRRKNG